MPDSKNSFYLWTEFDLTGSLKVHIFQIPMGAHGESTQVSKLDQGRPNLASLSRLSPKGPMYQCGNRLLVPDNSQWYSFTEVSILAMGDQTYGNLIG